MKILGIHSSPNTNGLTGMLVKAVLEGAEDQGAETKLVHLNQLDIRSCEAHNLDGRGWGTCRTNGICMLNDDFQKLRNMINEADALVFSTPVYFGDISESAKRFLDRLRRCEVFNRETALSRGKSVIGISAAGGSGGGAVNALRSLETYLRWLQFTIFDLVPVTQISKEHKLDMLKVAGSRIASQK